MGRSGMESISGKRIPTTIDAIRFGRHYLDPRDVRLKCLDVATVGLLITGIVIPLFYLV